jgi:Tol biopolymer transport system component
LIAAFLASGVAAGCDSGDERTGATRSVPKAAPSQETARIAAIRLGPGNPPRFALLTTDDDGSRQRVLVEAPRRGMERLGPVGAPAWSADAQRIYFVGVLGERKGDRFVYYESDAFVVDANGGEPRRITRSGDVETVASSPDGATLLVARAEHPGKLPFTVGLWLMDPDGRNARRLLDPEDGQLDLGGSWSPDGSTIVFTRCTFELPGERGMIENTCGVHTVSSDGSDLHELAERSSQPSYSPDGGRIAFVSDRDEHGEIPRGEDENSFANELYVMDADGDDQHRLTETESLDEASPSWSPDGSRIAYSRQGPARFTTQLMIVNDDGSCPTRILGNASKSDVHTPWFKSPAWRPGSFARDLTRLDCD